LQYLNDLKDRGARIIIGDFYVASGKYKDVFLMKLSSFFYRNVRPSTGPHAKLSLRYCYKTGDFATAASQNGVFITQGKFHKMI
jgi:hypothetical protein